MARTVVFFASHAAGGIRELWMDLAEAFRERGDDARVMALYPFDPAELDAAPEPDRPRWTYLVPTRLDGLRTKLRLLLRLAAWLRRDRPDVVICAMPAANVLVPAFARLFSPSTRVILSHHTPTDTHNRRLDAIDGWTGSLRTVRAIVSVSEAVNRSLDTKPAAYRRKRHVIGNALPRRVDALLDTFAPNGVRSAEARRAVAAGRLAPQKNYPMLIGAAAHMPDVHVDILGAGEDEADLRALAARLDAGNVRFLGQRPREAALAEIARGDVFVQVSLFEGHSLALLEAARLGLPLVVSNVPVQIEGITAEDGSRCGQAADLGDEAGLARVIRQLLDDPQAYARWSGEARRLAAEATFERMCDRYASLAA